MARRFDPERRDRIIDAAIDSIAEHGVAGTSHRKVAALADVPLGSMTYHFESMDDLLVEAFGRFATGISDVFTARLGAARTRPEAIDAVVGLVHDELQHSSREHVLTYELYTLAARRAEFRSITEAWMARSRAALGQHFAPDVARSLDALIEGSALHLALDRAPQSREETRAAVVRLVG